MENFHCDILENILSRLPVEEALQAKRVCKTWRAILHRPGFLFAFCDRGFKYNENVMKQVFYGDEYNHYDHAKRNYYYSHKTLLKIEHCRFMGSNFSDVMVGSCNGLVCFGKDNANIGTVPFLICNPLTGESVLTEYIYSELHWDASSSKKRLFYGRLLSGFGYCPVTNKYKVVTIYYDHNERKGHVQVYTVGSGKWRYVGCISRYKYCIFGNTSAIYANGALHWLHQGEDKYEIVAFDLEREKFSYIILPGSYQSQPKLLANNTLEYHTQLELLGGNNKLYLVCTNYASGCTEIWVYKNNNISSGKSYTKCSSVWIVKEFTIWWEDDSFSPFAITKDNQILSWYHTRFGLILYCYDPNTSTFNYLWDDEVKGMEGIYIDAIPHAHSTLSLKDLGETNITCLKDLEKLMLKVT